MQSFKKTKKRNGDILWTLCVYVANRWHSQMLQVLHLCWYLVTGHVRSPRGCCRWVHGWHLTVSIFALAHCFHVGFNIRPLLQGATSIQIDSILKANLTKKTKKLQWKQHFYLSLKVLPFHSNPYKAFLEQQIFILHWRSRKSAHGVFVSSLTRQ